MIDCSTNVLFAVWYSFRKGSTSISDKRDCRDRSFGSLHFSVKVLLMFWIDSPLPIENVGIKCVGVIKISQKLSNSLSLGKFFKF